MIVYYKENDMVEFANYCLEKMNLKAAVERKELHEFLSENYAIKIKHEGDE